MVWSKLFVASTLLAGLTCALPAQAQSSTESYEYDALGRLTKVQTTNGVNDGETREIEYDAAGNRVNYEATGEVAPPPPPPPPPPPSGNPQDALEADFVGRTNSGMWDFRAATNSGSFTAANIEGGLSSFTGTNGATVVAVDAVTGAQFASNDAIEASATGTFAIYILFRKEPGDVDGYLLNEPWPNTVISRDGSGTPFGIDARFYENGAFGTPSAGFDAFHDTLDDGDFYAVKLSPLSITGDISVGRTFNGIEADIVAIVAVDLNEVTDLSITEGLIADWFEDILP